MPKRGPQKILKNVKRERKWLDLFNFCEDISPFIREASSGSCPRYLNSPPSGFRTEEASLVIGETSSRNWKKSSRFLSDLLKPCSNVIRQ